MLESYGENGERVDSQFQSEVQEWVVVSFESSNNIVFPSVRGYVRYVSAKQYFLNLWEKRRRETEFNDE